MSSKKAVLPLLKSLALIGTTLCAFYFSYLPVKRTEQSMKLAATLLTRGRDSEGLSLLRHAVATDRYAIEPAVAESEVLHRRLLRVGKRPEKKETAAWRAAWNVARARASGDPAAMASLAAQPLHRYQVFGETEDLILARTAFADVLSLSPTDENHCAQLAVIEHAISEIPDSDDPMRSRRAAQRAEELFLRAETLAASGGIMTRSLRMQTVLSATVIGIDAADRPVLVSAAARMNYGR